MLRTVVVGVVHEQDTRAQSPLRWLAQHQCAYIDDWYGHAVVVADAGNPSRCLGNGRDADQWQHFGDLTGIKRVTVFAELKQQKQHVGDFRVVLLNLCAAAMPKRHEAHIMPAT